MGLFDTFKNMTVDAGLSIAFEHLKNTVINPNIKDFGTVTALRYENGTLHCRLTLLGLENEALEASCSSVQIADDGSSITLSDFRANKPFLENALNRFATRPFTIPDNQAVRAGILLLKKAMA